MLDFSFLAPCPSSGLVVHGEADEIVPAPFVAKLVNKLMHQRGIHIDYRVIPEASHFFGSHLDIVLDHAEDYLDTALHQRPLQIAMAG
jgi:alpha/beta superfamily hydrolase